MSSPADDIAAAATIFAACVSRHGWVAVERAVNLAHKGETWRVEAVRISPPPADEPEEGSGT